MPSALDKASSTQTGASFEATHWTTVLAAGEESSPRSRESLEKLCRAYWPPLYAFVRRRGCSPHDAQDRVQGFFARFLQRDWARDLGPHRGRFRTFLLAAFENFLRNEWRKNTTLKRGGVVAPVPLDLAAGEAFLAGVPPGDTLSARDLDRAWAAVLIGQVFEQLSQSCRQAGKAELFRELREHLISSREPEQIQAIASRLGLSEEGVRQARSRLRRQFREQLRQAVAHTVRDPAEIEDEARHLVAACAAESRGI